MKVKYLAALPLMVLLSNHSYADTNFKELILSALNSKSGTAESNVTGPLADKIRSTINRPNAVVHVEVRTLEKLPQEGCSRVKVRYTTPGTLLPMSDGSTQMLDMNAQINVCKNGLPPGM